MAVPLLQTYLRSVRFPAIIVAVAPHGENGAVVRILTEDDGVIPVYVPGARSRLLRPVLQPGNGVAVQLTVRSGAMARASIELVQSRTVLATGRATAAAVHYLAALVAITVEDGSGRPRLYTALDAILGAMVADLGDCAWWAGIAHFELLMLAELGFGLDLSHCAATGATGADADLAYVSPRSSQAVGRRAGAPYADKLLTLPSFLLSGGRAERSEVRAALRTTGFFLEREVMIGRAAALLPARTRLIAMV